MNQFIMSAALTYAALTYECWTYSRTIREAKIVIYKISLFRAVVGTGLNMLVWDRPDRNVVGQVGTMLGDVQT